MNTTCVVVAGVGGASLGTECLKSLRASGRFAVVAADVSQLAFGLYGEGLHGKAVLRSEHYIEDLIACCRAHGASVVVPGAEPTLKLIHENRARLAAAGVNCAINHPDVIASCSDKSATFERLAALGIPIPSTRTLKSEADVAGLPMPCIVKPSTGSGGSALVATASTHQEALMYARWIWASGTTAIAQQYLPAEGGEFTIGVLTLGNWTGSIAMRREFPTKLSYLVKNERFLISTGYSQGLVDDFPEVRSPAEAIARAIGSQGPLNIQGRMAGGTFLPFEINPRFSATTYLRHLAGFPEIEMHLDYLIHGKVPSGQIPVIRGFYLRSLTEQYVPTQSIERHR